MYFITETIFIFRWIVSSLKLWIIPVNKPRFWQVYKIFADETTTNKNDFQLKV